MAKTRVKSRAETVRVPTSRAEAEAMIARIGELARDQTLRETALEETIAKAKQDAEAEAKQPAAELEDLQRGLQIWAEAHRDDLTKNGRIQTVRLGTGEIGWRRRPPRVSVSNPDAVIEALRKGGLDRFIRTKAEVNREAMLAEPAVAKTIAGVKIGSAGEDFIVTPVTMEMADSPS
jgi:phage host-nuclease inhibitor protein Gam